ncbi:MAG: zinc ribbon domain-containing protein [Planctomycetia bacterium]|nr:zinc ribbon domain-containing protein [Planctomycetia bacterium]
MPTYSYKCDSCGSEFEKIESFHSPTQTTCQKCGKEAHRVIRPCCGIIFKGSGFYETDYKNKSSNSETKS